MNFSISDQERTDLHPRMTSAAEAVRLQNQVSTRGHPRTKSFFLPTAFLNMNHATDSLFSLQA